ncbi:MAG: GntR family transcriptional regulator [Spirochaetales bacterium]|jgi:GntR family transcriptional regulator|nr:GntR family transcriptional regulator [Spirochaetales bacterium]
MLNRSSPVPLYYQLYSLLLSDIHSGELKPGDMIPPEVALMEKYGVSRGTVRQAILDLVKNGYIYREKSKGSFVKSRFNTLVGFTNKSKGGLLVLSNDRRSIPLRSTVLEQKVLDDPPRSIRENLKLGEGEKVFYLKRVRYSEDQINTYVEDYLPYKRCPGIEKFDFTNASLYAILEENYHITPHHAQRIFECSKAAREEELEKLEITPDEAVLRCESFVYDIKDEPVEYYMALIKGSVTVLV